MAPSPADTATSDKPPPADAFHAAWREQPSTPSAYSVRTALSQVSPAFFPTDPRAPGFVSEVVAAVLSYDLEKNAERRAWMSAELARWSGQTGWAWMGLVDAAVSACTVSMFRELYERGWDSKPAPHLVGRLLAPEAPCVFGGVTKTMKTSLAVDMAAALATGTPFLQLPVERRVNILMLSAETDPRQCVAMFRQSLRARVPGWDDLAEDEQLKLSNRLTVVADRNLIRKKEPRKVLLSYLRADAIEVAILDPLYLLLPTKATTNLTATGAALRWLCDPIIQAGAAPVILHHFTRDAKPGEMPSLADLSGAGCAEFARSWLLVNRTKPYTGGKVHDLLALHGTSRGDAGTLRVRFDENNWRITTAGESPDPATPAYLKKR